jgi:hypothetical protein
LRRLAEHAQEGRRIRLLSPKPVSLATLSIELSALRYHELCCLEPQVLDRLARRLAGLGAERAAELARAEMCGVGELLDRQRRLQVMPGKVNAL